ncbi:hypothetical protein [Streptomyces inhibens]|uniref:hypothetical protein n=1 Tax=Streptomyces inhibens TaxID=2293571 RepID=UPI0015F27942
MPRGTEEVWVSTQWSSKGCPGERGKGSGNGGRRSEEARQAAVVRRAPAVCDSGGLEKREVAAHDSGEDGDQDQQRDRAGNEREGCGRGTAGGD